MRSINFIVVIAAVLYRPTPSGRVAASQPARGDCHQRAVSFYAWGWDLEEKGSFPSFEVSQEMLLLSPRATEQEVRSLDRSGEPGPASPLAFAMHRLVVDELKISETGLVLTPPAEPNKQHSGQLAASEVAQLRLNADWAILLARNTAAGDGGPWVEGLSGLARALFCAGARVLLVSYRSVCSKAAGALTTGMLEAQGRELSIGRVEVLRRTMVDLIERGPDPCSSYWAPFIAVDE